MTDGNTADVTTHTGTWEALVALTGENTFLYVALSGHRHKATYAALRIMPSLLAKLQVRAVSTITCAA